MDTFVICATALLASAVTLFSGFGLGTVLMPVFALFVPAPVAIAATAVVHLANNLFKVALLGRHANLDVVVRFAVPAAVAALAGASLLSLFAALPPIASYHLGETAHDVTAVKVVIGVLIVGFSVEELLPGAERLVFERRHLVVGGLLSGFFGGLSGNQGALRSAFLLKCGLSKEAFIGTGVVAAVVVDMVRLAVYGASFLTGPASLLEGGVAGMAGAATVAAFLGAFIGTRVLKKVTLRTVQVVVGVLMVVIGTALATGLV